MRRFSAEQGDGEDDGVEDGGAVVAAAEIGELLRDIVSGRGEALDEARCAVKGDESDAVRDVADDGVEDGPELLVVLEVSGAGASGFDDDGEGERTGVGVGYEGDMLRDAVVGELEVGGGEGEDDLAGLGGDQRGDFNEVGSDGESGWCLLAHAFLRHCGLLRRNGVLLCGRDDGNAEQQSERASDRNSERNGDAHEVDSL